MPTSSRTFIMSVSPSVSTRTPLTQILPACGFSSPRISLRTVLLPAPLAPRKIFEYPARSSKLTSFRITLSPNARNTRSKTMTGSPGVFTRDRRVSSGVGVPMSVEHADQQLGDDEVEDQHRDRSRHDRRRRALAHALRATGGTHADKARHADQRE